MKEIIEVVADMVLICYCPQEKLPLCFELPTGDPKYEAGKAGRAVAA
jgi:hypothetical protein